MLKDNIETLGVEKKADSCLLVQSGLLSSVST